MSVEQLGPSNHWNSQSPPSSHFPSYSKLFSSGPQVEARALQFIDAFDITAVEAGIVGTDVANHFVVIGDRLPDHDCPV